MFATEDCEIDLLGRPYARQADVHVADHSDHLALEPDRHVEHRGDAVRLEIALREFARLGIGLRQVGDHRPVREHGGEIDRIVGSVQPLAHECGIGRVARQQVARLALDRACRRRRWPNSSPARPGASPPSAARMRSSATRRSLLSSAASSSSTSRWRRITSVCWSMRAVRSVNVTTAQRRPSCVQRSGSSPARRTARRSCDWIFHCPGTRDESDSTARRKRSPCAATCGRRREGPALPDQLVAREAGHLAERGIGLDEAALVVDEADAHPRRVERCGEKIRAGIHMAAGTAAGGGGWFALAPAASGFSLHIGMRGCSPHAPLHQGRVP